MGILKSLHLLHPDNLLPLSQSLSFPASRWKSSNLGGDGLQGKRVWAGWTFALLESRWEPPKRHAGTVLEKPRVSTGGQAS